MFIVDNLETLGITETTEISVVFKFMILYKKKTNFTLKIIIFIRN
jgi:hypothetical protein